MQVNIIRITITHHCSASDHTVGSPHVVSTGNHFRSITSQIMSSHSAIDMNDELVNSIRGQHRTTYNKF